MTDDPKPRGRPAFKPTKAMRENVMLWKSCGMSDDEISAAVGCSRPTLLANFEWELANGRGVKRSETYKKAKELADEGNVSALRLLAQMQDGGLGAAPDLGKKEAARIAAKNPEAGTPLGDLMRRRRQANVQDLVTPPPDGWIRMEPSH